MSERIKSVIKFEEGQLSINCNFLKMDFIIFPTLSDSSKIFSSDFFKYAINWNNLI